MRISAAKEKIGCSVVNILYTTNVIKFTKNYNNENHFCELGKTIKEYLNKTTEIA
jgi:hypothetical protein